MKNVSNITIVITLCFALIFSVSSDLNAGPKLEKATFAGGCFWCMEPPFEKLDGVTSVVSGYTGGKEIDPTYKQVASGQTSHFEAVEIRYDPSKISYNELLDVFWMQIDPTDSRGQFSDRGSQYRTAIFYHDKKQKNQAEASKTKLDKSGRYTKHIVTQILKVTKFYKAEEYHQDYYKKNPINYKTYRYFSGRDSYLRRIWNDG